MGFFKFDVKDVFQKRLLLWQYEFLTPEAKELVDYTIKENIKCNEQLRVYSFWKTKTLLPLKKDLWSLTWNDRIELGLSIQENDFFSILRIVYGVNEKQYKKLELFNAFSVQKYIIEEFKQMLDIENSELEHEYTDEEKDAGIERLQEFSYYNTLDSLTNGNILVQEQWLQLPYKKIFRKMCLDKTRYEINENLKENAKRNAKRDS